MLILAPGIGGPGPRSSDISQIGSMVVETLLKYKDTHGIGGPGPRSSDISQVGSMAVETLLKYKDTPGIGGQVQ